jgi:hypothetical protein
LYFVLTLISALLIFIAFFYWPFDGYTILRWLVWATAVIGIGMFMQFRPTKNLSLWIFLLFAAGLLFIPVFPILTEGPLGFEHGASGIILILSGVKVATSK